MAEFARFYWAACGLRGSCTATSFHKRLFGVISPEGVTAKNCIFEQQITNFAAQLATQLVAKICKAGCTAKRSLLFS